MRLQVDDLSGVDIQKLLNEHIADAHTHSPPDSVFALDIDALRGDDITFWTLWSGEGLMGCGALKRLSNTHGEIKSMRTVASAQGQGVGSQILAHIIDTAMGDGLVRLSLETGSNDPYKPARNLYVKFGFKDCGPFADYKLNEFSVFMTRVL